METMRVELVEQKKKNDWLKATIPSIIAAFVALLGIWVSFLTYQSTSEDREIQRVAAEEEREAQREEREAQRVAGRNNRFTYAIEHLKDDSLAIRMAALFELEKLGLESEELQKSIVRILAPFIREGMENRELHYDQEYSISRPKEDVFLACEIASLFYEQTGCQIEIERLNASKLDLGYIRLKGANLPLAQLSGTRFSFGDIEGTEFINAYLEDEAWFFQANLKDVLFSAASLKGANLKEAFNLTAAQLLDAIVDDTTLLDPDLRAEYDRLKAEQGE